MEPHNMDRELTEDVPDPEPEDGVPRDKGDLEGMALGYLSRARKLRSRNEWEPNEEADFYLAAADVMAKLELANALRDSRQS